MKKNNYKYDFEFDWSKKNNINNCAYAIDRLNSTLNALNSNSDMNIGSKESNLNIESNRDKSKFNFNSE